MSAPRARSLLQTKPNAAAANNAAPAMPMPPDWVVATGESSWSPGTITETSSAGSGGGPLTPRARPARAATLPCVASAARRGAAAARPTTPELRASCMVFFDKNKVPNKAYTRPRPVEGWPSPRNVHRQPRGDALASREPAIDRYDGAMMCIRTRFTCAESTEGGELSN